MRILLVTSELFPLVKTGGLADAVAGLAAALSELGHDVRIALPAYHGVLEQMQSLRRLGSLAVRGQHYELHEGKVKGLPPLWLFASMPLFERAGDPYHDEHGLPFADNAWRYGTFCEAVARAASGLPGEPFVPEVVHGNDWQTGLSLPWLQYLRPSVARVYTIHNLAYQGVFPASEMETLGLPADWWQADGVEFYDQLSFMKGGLVFAHQITTVSPTYAREILTPEHGQGLDGLLSARAAVLSGVVNGIDVETWNPKTDRHLVQRYGVEDRVAGKRINRQALQKELGLVADDAALLIGCITRLAYQKGMDLLVAGMPELMKLPVQIVLLGAGDRSLGDEFEALSARWHGRFAFHNGYSEGLAHRIEAGADTFLMPSRYEPCGLNQMYSQRYGTPPIVHRTGGLADTVIDASGAALSTGRASGIQIDRADVLSVIGGVRRALTLRAKADAWQAMQRTGMAADFSWTAAARRYLDVYQRASEAAGDDGRSG